MCKMYLLLITISSVLFASESGLLHESVYLNYDTVQVKKRVSFVLQDSEGFNIMLAQLRFNEKNRSFRTIFIKHLVLDDTEENNMRTYRSVCLPKLLCCAFTGVMGYVTYLVIQKMQ